MQRLTRVVAAAFVGTAGMLIAAAPLGAQGSRVPAEQPTMQARAATGSISGVVLDQQGGGLAGAMVSALGATLASTVTDERGQFALNQLPPGEYLVRAHLLGFAASSGDTVRVGRTPAVHRLQLRRLDATVGTAGGAAPLAARPIVAAGFNLPPGAGPEEGEEIESDDHPHSETAWRLRHIKRSILKNAGPIAAYRGDDQPLASGSLLGRAVESAATLATSLFTEFPFSGEVNFLTTGATAPGALLSSTTFPRGVAYLALAAPGAGGDWSIRAAMSEGDLSSWIVAGAFSANPDPARAHQYEFGLSYSIQEYTGGNPSALAAVTDGSRNVGELYAFDTWAVSRILTLDYGARYAHYDYLERRSLLSPRAAVTVEPVTGARVRVAVAQRMVAPGEEEFLATNTRGPWLPPERTFAPLPRSAERDGFRVERMRSYDVTLEKDVAGDYTIGVGRFHQSIDDQLVTLFGLQLAGGPRSIGHYYVGRAGAVDADGWSLRFATPAARIVKGSVQYSRTHARWTDRGDLSRALVAPLTLRPDVEYLHDLTTALAADIPQTATRLYVLYKMNSGFIRSDPVFDRPGLDRRFDVQVNQGLPLNFAGTRWEVLIGLRNLFRDPADPASVYDELLVVRPPKRLVGGFLVRF